MSDVLTPEQAYATVHSRYCACGCDEIDSVLVDSHEALRAELGAAMKRLESLTVLFNEAEAKRAEATQYIEERERYWNAVRMLMVEAGTGPGDARHLISSLIAQRDAALARERALRTQATRFLGEVRTLCDVADTDKDEGLSLKLYNQVESTRDACDALEAVLFTTSAAEPEVKP